MIAELSGYIEFDACVCVLNALFSIVTLFVIAYHLKTNLDKFVFISLNWIKKNINEVRKNENKKKTETFYGGRKEWNI